MSETVKARYVGDYPVFSMPHDKVLKPGDVVDMREEEARERPDFEVMTEEKKGKGGDK